MPQHHVPQPVGSLPGTAETHHRTNVLISMPPASRVDRHGLSSRSVRSGPIRAPIVALTLALFLLIPGFAVSANPTPNFETGGSVALTPHEFLTLRLFNDVLSGGNPAACPELVWPGAVITTPDGVYHGSDGMSQFVAELRGSFPDARFRMSEMAVLGDTIVVRWVMSGTHDGAYQGLAPTGSPVVLHGVVVMRVSNGKIVEEWVSFDRQDIVAQLESRRGSFPGVCTLCELPE